MKNKEVLVVGYKNIYQVHTVGLDGLKPLEKWRVRRRHHGKTIVTTHDNFESAKAASISNAPDEIKAFNKTLGWTFQKMLNHKRDREKLARGTIEGMENRSVHLASLWDYKITDVSAKIIDGWINLLHDEEYKKNFSKSRKDYRQEFSLIKSIFNFYREYIDETFVSPLLNRHKKNLLPSCRRTKFQETRSLNVEEMKRFIEAIDSEVCKDLALFQQRTGTRVGEAAALTFEQIDWKNGKVIINKHVDWSRRKNTKTLITNGTKGGPGRAVLLPSDCLEMLQKRFKNSSSDLVFADKVGKLLSYRSIQYRYDKALKKIGIFDRSGTHLLRHSLAVDFLSSTKDIHALQKILGHASLKDTLKYGQYQQDDVLKATHDYHMKIANRSSLDGLSRHLKLVQ